jgi:hypothetical protein
MTETQAHRVLTLALALITCAFLTLAWQSDSEAQEPSACVCPAPPPCAKELTPEQREKARLAQEAIRAAE